MHVKDMQKQQVVLSLHLGGGTGLPLARTPQKHRRQDQTAEGNLLVNLLTGVQSLQKGGCAEEEGR